MKSYYVEVTKEKAEWYFRIKSRNGRIICHSEQYASKASATRTARMFLRNIKEGDFEGDIKL